MAAIKRTPMITNFNFCHAIYDDGRQFPKNSTIKNVGQPPFIRMNDHNGQLYNLLRMMMFAYCALTIKNSYLWQYCDVLYNGIHYLWFWLFCSHRSYWFRNNTRRLFLLWTSRYEGASELRQFICPLTVVYKYATLWGIWCCEPLKICSFLNGWNRQLS